MLVVFRDLGLEKYIAKDAKVPESADTTKPETKEDLEVKKKWAEGDGKACTWIELSIGNAKMIHISGLWRDHCIPIPKCGINYVWSRNPRANLECWPLGIHCTGQQPEQRKNLTWLNTYQFPETPGGVTHHEYPTFIKS